MSASTTPPRFRRVVAATVLLLTVALFAACAAAPRFPADVIHGMSHEPIIRIDTQLLRIYTPESRREDALRIAAGIETCVRLLDPLTVHNPAQRRIPVFVPDSEFNNAYVMPPFAGDEGHTVIPPHFSQDFFGELGLSLSPGFIACHEGVHVVHAQQVSGLVADVNKLLGPLFSPQLGFDPWVWEGLAVHYETALNPGMGRMASPLWRQTFRSAYSTRRFRAGDLSVGRSDIPWGSWYLNGAHFVEWLIETHGEQRIWRLVGRQSNALLFPFGVGGRFQRVYGKPLGALIRDFADHLEATLEPASRPEDQRIVRQAGREPLYVTGPDGRWALLSEDLHRPSRIEVRDANGRLLARRALPDLLPPRRITVPLIAGLSFSPDGEHLYFTALDAGAHAWRTRLMRLSVRGGRVSVVASDLRGGGGDLSPDGRFYLHPHRDTDGTTLVAIDVRDGSRHELLTLPAGHHLLHPRFSPDGRSLAASLLHEGEQRLVRIDLPGLPGDLDSPIAAPSLHILPAAGPMPMYPSWVDDHRLLYTHRVDETMQVATIDREGQRSEVLSRAPWLAAQPRIHDGAIRFLNVDGFDLTLDEIPLPEHLLLPPDPSPDPAASTAPSAALEEAAPLSARPLATVRVLDESPYSLTDNLFLPRSRFLWYRATPGNRVLGAAAHGYDELSRNAWAISLDYGIEREHLGWQVSWVNTQLSPVLLFASAGEAWSLYTLDLAPDIDLLIRDRNRAASLFAATAIRTQPIAFGLVLGENTYNTRGELDVDPLVFRLLGPQVAFRYSTGRGAARLPIHSAILVEGAAAHYAEALGSTTSISDLRGELQLHVPALIPRTTLRLRGVERLVHSPDPAGLLRVGGTDDVVLFRSEDESVPDPILLVEGLPTRFAEPVRGFESSTTYASRMTLAEVRWRWSLPIERGVAGLFLILPAHLVHSLAFEFFGTAFALDSSYDDPAAAAGGSADLTLLVGPLPLTFRYQLSRRLTGDEALSHLLLLRVGD